MLILVFIPATRSKKQAKQQGAAKEVFKHLKWEIYQVKVVNRQSRVA